MSDDPAWQPREVWDGASIQALNDRTDDDLRQAMRGSAMRRTKVVGLRRNLVLALEAGRRGSASEDVTR
jgi:epoxyqueuosine reductase QueG